MRITIILLLSLLLVTSSHSQNIQPTVGQAPPEFSYLSITKGEITSYKAEEFKNTVILIDFWATWCGPCIESIPHLNSLIEKYKGKNVKFISITYEPEKLVQKFLADHPMKSDVGLDEDFSMFRNFNAWGILM
jgi:thiol-disulfide isomerase/thioredoxin